MQNFSASQTNNKSDFDIKEAEIAFKKIIEEENNRRDEMMAKQKEEQEQKQSLKDRFANSLKKNLQAKMDYDIRQACHLGAIRKFFEEVRTTELGEINNERLFSSEVRNHDGTVHKDEFIYRLMNTDYLTLTRTEAFYIVDLMSNIVSKDKPNIDIDELQHGYAAYLKYSDLIQKRVIDLLEKFKLAISKRVETDEEIHELIDSIESKAQNSQLLLEDLKHEMEKKGVQIRDAIYEQLQCFFDLDHSGTIYIASFCHYLRNPDHENLNFFKLNPSLLSTHIMEYIKNCLQTRPENLDIL